VLARKIFVKNKKVYHCYAATVGTKYLGEVKANSEKEAIELAEKLESCDVGLCHQCSSECGQIEIDEIIVECEEDDKDRRV
jgi:hypothetical protein